MEALYSKLYNKYIQLKKEKESQFDKLNRDQELKFMNFVEAAEQMIQHLTNEKERLNNQVVELQSKLDSFRSSNDEQHSHYEKLLLEESQKNEELSEEIARLQKLKHYECSHCNASEESGLEGKSSKKRKISCSTKVVPAMNVDGEVEYPPGQLSYLKQGSGDHLIIQQPACCRRGIYFLEGGDAIDTCHISCVFQHLVEFVVGMKASVYSESEEPCVLVQHQSSGYSFSLTWITNSCSEVELLYRMLSLGTIERVAPDWMKETLVFGTSMCGVFFNRVARIIRS